MVNGAIIDLDALTEKYNSDYYIDFNDDGYDNNDLLYEDINILGAEDVFDNYTPIADLEEFIVHEVSTIIVGYCYDDPSLDQNEDICETCGDEGCPIKQEVWNIEILYDDLDNVLNQINLFNNDLNWDENFLTDNWASSAPTDNLVFGTDIKLNTNKIKLNAGIAFSAFNNNIWTPAMTDYELDTINDDHQDCYINRSYSNLPITNSSFISKYLFQVQSIVSGSNKNTFLIFW